MLEIKEAIIAELEPVEITMPDQGGEMSDSVDNYVVCAGMQFPVIKISNTVIAQRDISTFTLQCGLQRPIPVASFVIRDTFGHFRETDYVNNATEIRLWLGNAMSQELPLNYAMRPIDVQVKNGLLIIKAELAVPTDVINIEHGTVQEMLQAFADLTKLGIKCNYDDLLSKTITKNFVNVTPMQFIDEFAKLIGVDWFIDAQYHICMYDVQKLIDEHTDKTCDIVFYTLDNLEKPETVSYTNKVDNKSQFTFTKFGYDFIKADLTVEAVEAVLFDKSFSPDIEKLQVIEEEFVDMPAKLSMDSIYFEADFDPYKLVGSTADLQIYTTMNMPKRGIQEEYEAGDKADQNQLLIADVSGIYALTDVKYMYNGGMLSAWTSFRRPSDTDDSNAVQ